MGTHSGGSRVDLRKFLENLRVEAGGDAAELFLTPPVGSDLVMVAQAGRAARAFRERTRFRSGEGFPGLVAESRKPLVCRDLGTDFRYLRRSVLQQGFRGYICTPVWGRGFLGSLNVAFRRDIPDEFHIQQVVERAADRLGPAIELARFEAAEPLRALSFDPALSPRSSFQATAGKVLEILLAEANATCGLILLPDQGGTLAIATESGMPPGALRAAGARIACSECAAMSGPGSMAVATGCPAPAPICRAVARGIPVIVCLPLLEPGLSRTPCLGLLEGGFAPHGPEGVAIFGYDRRLPFPFAHQAFLHEALPLARLVLNAAQATLRRSHRSGGSREPGPDGAVWVSPQAGTVQMTSPPSGKLETQCFGRLRVFMDGVLIPPEAFGRRRSVKLLKILLVRQGKAVHRDELVEWLWPEAEGESAATALFDKALHYLRRGLAVPGRNMSDLVRRDGPLVWLDLKDPLWLDLMEFERLAASGARLLNRGRDDDALVAYRQAIRLYTGDLLECEPFADWCAAERTYFREKYLRILEAAGSLHLDAGQVDQALETFRLAIRAEPTREGPHRAIMHALRGAGRHSEAIAQFKECQRELQKDLGVDVSPETARLRDEIAGEMSGR